MKSGLVSAMPTGLTGTRNTWWRSSWVPRCRNDHLAYMRDMHLYKHNIAGTTMHPLRKLRESGKPTPAQIGELLAENVVFNSPILARPIEGREIIAAIFAQSSSTRGSGTYINEFKLAERH